MTVTSTQFVAAVQRLILSPNNQNTYEDADYLAIGDRKIMDTIVPLIDGLDGEFFVTKSNVPMVAEQDTYFLPSRALARKLREVKLVNSADERFDFPKVSIEREQLYQASGAPFSFYFMGDRFVIVPPPTTTDFSIQYWYFLAPGALIPYEDAAIITGISGDDVTVSSVPSAIITGSVVDFIAGRGGNGCLALDKTIANIAGTTITFTTGDIPSDLAVGDYVSISATSPVLQIPDAAVPFLVTLTAMDILQGLSDFEGYDRLHRIAYGQGGDPGQRKNLISLLEPRVEGETTVIIGNNGLLNRSFNGRRWWGR
jgi:hypothetical protein